MSGSAGLGHNGGPTMEAGVSWRRQCWSKARRDLLPHLPIEVLRIRVRRAKELGLEYRTYASVRAASGHDVVAFLFSSNALRVFPGQGMPQDRVVKLADVMAVRIGLAQGRLSPEEMMQAGQGVIDGAHLAPFALASFAEARVRLRAALGKVPADGVLLVGDAALEADWCAAGGLAGYVPAARYFG